MKVRTKYSVGDIVWCIFAGEPIECKIIDIKFLENENFKNLIEECKELL